MFQGPKGYIAQICEVQQNDRYTLFLVNSPLIYILFSLYEMFRFDIDKTKIYDQVISHLSFFVEHPVDA